MRLAAIVDHRGRSATAIETSVLFVDSENAARRQLVPRFSFAPSLFPAFRKQLRHRGYVCTRR